MISIYCYAIDYDLTLSFLLFIIELKFDDKDDKILDISWYIAFKIYEKESWKQNGMSE